MMAMIEPKAGKPFVKKDATPSGDITAIVTFTGDKDGTLSLSFSKKCAIAMVKNMLGDDIADILKDAQDAVGEVTNMISGQARAGLTELGINLQGSTPRVFFGKPTEAPPPGPAFAIPFDSSYGDFTLEFTFA